jgi:hypothetical protein
MPRYPEPGQDATRPPLGFGPAKRLVLILGDVHAITLHIGVHPRVMETTGRVLLGLEPDTPFL